MPNANALSTYEATVLRAWSPTSSTRAVRLTKPNNFSFETSQAVRLFLHGPDGDVFRPMSIASSPDREYLEFAVRRSNSDFKRAFFSLQTGDSVRLFGPRGTFLLEWNTPGVMLAGGIGITPFRSMIQTMADRSSGPPTLLVYANHSPEDVAFKEELDDLVNGRDWIEILYTVSVTSRDVAWPHRIGRIDLTLLKEIEARHPGAIHYLAGPAPFVDALSGALLVELGVDRGQILAEVFRGYDTEPVVADVT
jgi:ferredoxin-NADP reductase